MYIRGLGEDFKDSDKVHLYSISNIINKDSKTADFFPELNFIDFVSNFDKIVKFFGEISNNILKNYEETENKYKNLIKKTELFTQYCKNDITQDNSFQKLELDRLEEIRIQNLDNLKEREKFIEILKQTVKDLAQKQEQIEKNVSDHENELQSLNDKLKLLEQRNQIMPNDEELKKKRDQMQPKIEEEQKNYNQKKLENRMLVLEKYLEKSDSLCFSNIDDFFKFEEILKNYKDNIDKFCSSSCSFSSYIETCSQNLMSHAKNVAEIIKNEKKQSRDKLIDKMIGEDHKENQEALGEYISKRIFINPKLFTENDLKIVCREKDHILELMDIEENKLLGACEKKCENKTEIRNMEKDIELLQNQIKELEQEFENEEDEIITQLEKELNAIETDPDEDLDQNGKNKKERIKEKKLEIAERKKTIKQDKILIKNEIKTKSLEVKKKETEKDQSINKLVNAMEVTVKYVLSQDSLNRGERDSISIYNALNSLSENAEMKQLTEK